MKKSILKFTDKKIQNSKAIKGGKINTSDEHLEMNDDETKQAKSRRVTFILL